jgi:hypothetical protein
MATNLRPGKETESRVRQAEAMERIADAVEKIAEEISKSKLSKDRGIK